MSTLTETSNATTVGEAYQAFGRGDIATILGLLDSNVEWDVYPAGYVPHKLGVEHLKARRGPGEVVGFFAEIGTWTVIRFDVEEIIGDGPTVVARIAMEFELPSGGAFASEDLHEWRFGDDGKVVSFRHYVDTAQHIAAAGGEDTRR